MAVLGVSVVYFSCVPGKSAQTTWMANANRRAPTRPNVFTTANAIYVALPVADSGDVIYAVPSTFAGRNITIES